MTFEDGLLLMFIGCSLTVAGFLAAFLVADRIRRKAIDEEIRKREAKKNPYHYGDDTV